MIFSFFPNLWNVGCSTLGPAFTWLSGWVLSTRQCGPLDRIDARFILDIFRQGRIVSSYFILSCFLTLLGGHQYCSGVQTGLLLEVRVVSKAFWSPSQILGAPLGWQRLCEIQLLLAIPSGMSARNEQSDCQVDSSSRSRSLIPLFPDDPGWKNNNPHLLCWKWLHMVKVE